MVTPIVANMRQDTRAPSAHGPAPSSRRPRPSAHGPAPTAQRPAPSAHGPAPTAQRPGPSAHGPAPTAQRPRPSAQRPRPSAQRPRPSAHGPARSSQHQAPSAQRRIVAKNLQNPGVFLPRGCARPFQGRNHLGVAGGKKAILGKPIPFQFSGRACENLSGSTPPARRPGRDPVLWRGPGWRLAARAICVAPCAAPGPFRPRSGGCCARDE